MRASSQDQILHSRILYETRAVNVKTNTQSITIRHLQVTMNGMGNIGGVRKHTTHRIEQVEVNGARCHTRRQARAQAVQVTEVELPLHLGESRLTCQKLGGDRWILR